jgi:hypothetical protein
MIAQAEQSTLLDMRRLSADDRASMRRLAIRLLNAPPGGRLDRLSGQFRRGEIDARTFLRLTTKRGPMA